MNAPLQAIYYDRTRLEMKQNELLSTRIVQEEK